MDMGKQNPKMKRYDKNHFVFLFLFILVVGMGGIAYGSVPLYQLFCQITGYGGTTQVSSGESSLVIRRKIKVRFDANVDQNLDWKFEPAERSVVLKIGENRLAFYNTKNMSQRPLVGTATFNVTPHKAGQYFNKVDCFCFTQQLLKPGEQVSMPVSFFIDAEMAKDPNLDDVSTITLSYTFFLSEDQSPARELKQANVAGRTSAMVVD